jgi:hypothetical protein
VIKKRNKAQKLQRFFYHQINITASKYGPRCHLNNKEKNIGITFFGRSQKLLARKFKEKTYMFFTAESNPGGNPAKTKVRSWQE